MRSPQCHQPNAPPKRALSKLLHIHLRALRFSKMPQAQIRVLHIPAGKGALSAAGSGQAGAIRLRSQPETQITDPSSSLMLCAFLSERLGPRGPPTSSDMQHGIQHSPRQNDCLGSLLLVLDITDPSWRRQLQEVMGLPAPCNIRPWRDSDC